QVGMYVMSATQSRSGPVALKSRSTRSGAGRASRSRTVVWMPLRRLTPAKPSVRMSRATRLRPMWTPSAASSAWTRRAPDVPLAPEPPQLLTLLGGQTVLAVAVVAIRLDDPVADRLRRRLELLRQIFRSPPGSHQLNEPPLELRRIRNVGLGHRELLFP